MPSAIDIATLTAQDFEAHRETPFELKAAAASVSLRLAEVSSSGAARRAGGAFSLIFVGPAGPFLPQATYPIVHPALGTLEIFIVPIGPMHGGNAYQAVFA